MAAKRQPPSIFQDPAPEPPAREHPCHVCGARDAGYGFALSRFGGRPGRGTPLLWYCATHRHIGEARLAARRRE